MAGHMSQTAHNQYRYLGARNAWVCIFVYIPIARDARASREMSERSDEWNERSE